MRSLHHDGRGRGRRARRRAVIRAVGVASVPLIAGCLGDETGDDDPGDDAAEDSGETADDAEETDDDPGETTDDGTGDEGPADDTEEADDAPDVRPSEIDLEPSDAWDDDHPDVEIPDEPEQAVLVVDDVRVEMTGDLAGGPNESMYEAVTDDDEFSGDGAYFIADGQFSPTEESLSEHGWEGGHQLRFLRRSVGWTGNSFAYVHADEFQLFWPDITSAAQYRYREEMDGPTQDQEAPGMNYGDEPFLRIDRSGVVTAVGTIGDPGDSDVPEGASFEFGARAQEDWAERWEGN